MSYKARAFRVFVASPSDVDGCRRAVRRSLEKWNIQYGQETGIILVPAGWDMCGGPEMGIPAQSYINMEILDGCDVLIALFWTKLGTKTTNYESGTTEEIERNLSNKKLTMVYFSDEPIQQSHFDAHEYQRLLEYKTKMRERGLYGTFNNLDDLEQKLVEHIHAKYQEGKFRSNWDSDNLARIKDDEELAREIANYYPMVAKNVVRLIVYENRSQVVWAAILDKLVKSPADLRDTLIFLAKSGAVSNYLFREGSTKLSVLSQHDFCNFMSDLYSINKYSFFELYHQGLMTDVDFKRRMDKQIEKDKELGL